MADSRKNAGMDFDGITSRMQQTWAAGDFNRIALGIIEASEQLVSAADVRPSARSSIEIKAKGKR